MTDADKKLKEREGKKRRNIKRLLFLLILALIPVSTLFFFGGDRSRWYEYQFDYIKDDLEALMLALKSYYRKENRYPTNDEGMAVLPQYSKPVDSSCLSDNRTPKSSAVGPLSRWEVPYVYENRRGIDPEKFADSPVEKEHAERYSLKVDNGIYVYSSGGYELSKDYDLHAKYRYFLKWGPLALLAYFLTIYIVVSKRWKPSTEGMTALEMRKRSAKIAGKCILVFLSLIFTFFLLVVDCGPISLPREKRPQYTKTYRALLGKYKDRGVIKEETYKTLLETLKKEHIALDVLYEWDATND